eukprot:GHVN01063278.1.p1 GENE.GHVN01063278.1~~GHVN01063278.1.p1  ORF type:complete len:253 (+),score=33.12 GHVN01063278.1:36-794(+)
MALSTNSASSSNSILAAAYGNEPSKRTLQPYVTGSSVIGVKYQDGVMLACDTLGSYGSSARYHNIQRIEKVGTTSLLAASGEISDFQWLSVLANELHLEDANAEDGHIMSSRELASFLGRVMYNRRSKFNPLWNSLLVAGYEDGKSHLSYVDLLGTTYEEDCIATGFGAYFAMPILREKAKPTMTEQEARQLLEECMLILFYRDCQAHNKIQFATATAQGLKIESATSLKTSWAYEGFKKPTSQMDMVGNAW